MFQKKRNSKIPILIIAHDFPPYGGGGVMRILKFVKYMRDFDFSPVVLTIKPKEFWNSDKSLLEEIKDIEIFRTFTIELRGLSIKKKLESNKLKHSNKLLTKITRQIFIPDYQLLWVPFCLLKAIKLIKKYNIKYVMTTSPPNSVNFTGYLLKKIFSENIKWIADMRDFWTDCPVFRRNKIKPVLWFEKKIERKILTNSDLLITATSIIEKRLKDKYADLNSYTITNGFDKDDFDNIENLKDSLGIDIDENNFNIIYSGSLNDWRNPEYLFRALEKLIIRDSKYKNIKVYFIGYTLEKYKNLVSEKIIKNVFFYQHISHIDSLKILKKADALLLMISEFEGEGTLTGKIFDYIGAEKIILGLVPKNDIAEKLIVDNNLGVTCELNSADRIKENIIKLYNNEFDFKMNNNTEVFLRRNLTKQLCELISEL